MVRAFAVPESVVGSFPRGLYSLHTLSGPAWTRHIAVGQLWVPRGGPPGTPCPRAPWKGSCTHGDGYYAVRPSGTRDCVAIAYIDNRVLLTLRWVEGVCVSVADVLRTCFGDTPRSLRARSPAAGFI